MQLGGQAACCVDQHHVTTPCFTGRDGIKAHGGRIAPFLTDDLHRIALGPHGQLLARCRPKSVCRSQQHTGALIGQVVGELANGGGFTSAIDARHHDDHRLLVADSQLFLQRHEQVCNRLN